MNRIALVLAVLLAVGASPTRAAIDVTVANVGSIANQSVSLPAEATPGSSGTFDEFFEFTLPVRETVTLSMTDSATGAEQIGGGVISLNDRTSTGPGPLFIPMGALIESATLINFIGGQGGDVTPDPLNPGAYFAEVSGVSGSSPLKIAVGSTLTATAVPEPATWAMMLVGFAGLMFGAATRKRMRELY